MKQIVMAALAVAAWCASIPAPARAQEMITGQNPETVRALFESWDYHPTPLRIIDGQASFDASVGGFTFAVAFNGCTAGRGCQYLVFVANYSDVTNPPAAWLNQQNFHYDLVTVSRREDDGLLSLRTGITLGREGIPVSTLRLAVDNWLEDTEAVANNAVEAGLSTDPEAPAQ